MIKFKTIDPIYTPKAQTKLSVGLDVKTTEEKFLKVGEIAKFGLGVSIEEIPSNIYLQLHIRSSLRFKHGLTQLGTGIIDGDFKDEIKMILKNEGPYSIKIRKGDRIGQLIPAENITLKYCEQYILEETRNGGFGSTN